MYSLRPEILVTKIDKRDVSRCILVLDTSLFIHFDDKYFWTEEVRDKATAPISCVPYLAMHILVVWLGS